MSLRSELGQGPPAHSGAKIRLFGRRRCPVLLHAAYEMEVGL